MDFSETMQALFGINPSQGQLIGDSGIPAPTPIRAQAPQPVSAMQPGSVSPMTPEAADPTTPNPTGRVLATLPRNGAPPQNIIDRLNPQRDALDDLGGGLMAGAANYKPEFGGAGNFLMGLAGALHHGSTQRDLDSKNALETYKTLFDIQDRSAGRLEAQQQHELANKHLDAQLAETSRYHDMLGSYYGTKTDGQLGIIGYREDGVPIRGFISGPNVGKTPEQVGLGAGAGGLPGGGSPAPMRKLTPTEIKMVDKADSAIEMLNTNLDLLKQAKELSPKARSGMFMGNKGLNEMAAGAIGDQASIDTADLNKLIGGLALTQLKPLLPGQISNYEDKLMQDLSGTSNVPDAVRQKIYDRATKMFQRKLAAAQRQADQIRSGTYLRPGGGESTGSAQPEAVTTTPISDETAAPAPAPRRGGATTPSSGGGTSTGGRLDASPTSGGIPQGAIDHLKANPALREHFDQKYGPGASDKVLGGGRKNRNTDIVAGIGGEE